MLGTMLLIGVLLLMGANVLLQERWLGATRTSRNKSVSAAAQPVQV